MSKFVNLTPHAIRIVREDGTLVVEFPPDGTVARVAVTREPVGTEYVAGWPLDGAEVPMTYPSFGVVEGLPEPVTGTIFIVSSMVREALRSGVDMVDVRGDVVSPGPLVRDAKGQPVGCLSLDCNR